MAAPKYQHYYEMMIAQNTKLFDEFRKVHDGFAADPDKWRDQFNEVGREVQDVMRIYENRLCGQSEGAGYSKFTLQLADKFQMEVRKHFPKINQIGLS